MKKGDEVVCINDSTGVGGRSCPIKKGQEFTVLDVCPKRPWDPPSIKYHISVNDATGVWYGDFRFEKTIPRSNHALSNETTKKLTEKIEEIGSPDRTPLPERVFDTSADF